MLTVLIVLSLSWMILAVDGFSATARQKPKMRHISWDAPPPEMGVSPSAPYEYSSRGIKYNLSCMDIQPAVGTILQNDQIGDTWYDMQQNGSMGRMISVTSNGYRHFSWMYTAGPYYSGTARGVYANCKDPSGGYMGITPVEYSSTTTPGYSNQTHLHTGESVVIYHKSQPVSPSYHWAATLSKDDQVCGGFFTKHWDIPDWITGVSSGEPGLWPQAEAFYDDSTGRDYIHVVMTEGTTEGGRPDMVAYERCYFGTDDSVICQAYEGGQARRYAIYHDVPGPGSFAPISHFDSSCNITPVVAVSPVSSRVTVAFLKPADPAGTCQYGSDVCYIESMQNGDDWIAGSPWPPPEYNITNYGLTGNERAYNDLNACYDFQDSLHIVYVTCGFDLAMPGYYMSGVARLYHWSKKSGISMISSAVWSGSDPGSHNANIGKMSISAQDPIYHPAGDSVYLYTIWTQFDTADNSVCDYTNGELYGCGSYDGGQTWGRTFNLTNTRSPGCLENCLSEHWSSLAQNMYNGDLHIQYICDRDANIPNAPCECTRWTHNSVMYLHLTAWDVNAEPQVEIKDLVPPSWFHPTLKVTPGGSRNLIFQVINSGNALMIFSVNSDHPCIQVNVPPTMLPVGDSANVTVTVLGAGACVDTFIAGNVLVHTNEGGGKTDSLRVYAVVANDYYECPIDPETYDTLDNGVLRLYTNANGEEWIHDVGTRIDTSYEVFFAGGTIIATTSGLDTVVGRFMRDDWRSGARDKLYSEECDVSEEPGFDLVYTKNVYIEATHLQPPERFRWFWWEISKQTKLFKNTAPELYKHLVIEYVTVKRHDPPIWWPDQSPFTGYEDTYIGVAQDIDCPWDTVLCEERGPNLAGYDGVNHIAWQKGYGAVDGHPEYDHYYAGFALANGGMPGESIVPYGSYNVRNGVYLYPQATWGWLDGQLYQLAATPGPNIEHPDSIIDRSLVFTARKIDAGSDSNASVSFTVVMVLAPQGLSQLQEYVDSARAIVTKESINGGLPAICGDVNGDFTINLGDVVYLITYLYKSGPAPKCPTLRADGNSSGVVELGDVVQLISYLYKSGALPLCPGIW
jgi:hypothetical protein